jgi:hypothetical protein
VYGFCFLQQSVNICICCFLYSFFRLLFSAGLQYGLILLKSKGLHWKYLPEYLESLAKDWECNAEHLKSNTLYLKCLSPCGKLRIEN